MRAATHHWNHENDDLLAIGATAALGAAALVGVISLIHQPAVQALIAGAFDLLSQPARNVVPHLAPGG